MSVAAAAAKRKAGEPAGMTIIKQVKREAEDAVETAAEREAAEVATIVAAEETVKEETVATTATLQTDGQQIYIIQVRVQSRNKFQEMIFPKYKIRRLIFYPDCGWSYSC